MPKIFDYKCTFLDSIVVHKNEILSDGVKFPDAHLKSDMIVKYALLRKKASKAHFVELPFCHTVEADSLGGKINYGDDAVGPRVSEFNYKSLEEIYDVEGIDFNTGRISEVLKSVKLISDTKEDVVFDVVGPFSILNNLIDTEKLYVTIRKDKELFKKTISKIGIEIYKYIALALDSGARFINLADPAAAVSIIGPKMTKDYVNDFLYEFIARLVELAKLKNAMILLCPRITFALYCMGLIRFENVALKDELVYFDALKLCINEIKLTGQMCIKNTEYVLKPAFIKKLVFTNI